MRMGISPDKTFLGDLKIIEQALTDKEQFAFSRFSDGEVYMLQNQEIIMEQNGAKVGDKILGGYYSEDDWKHFNPETDGFYREKLEESLIFKKDNYIKGLSCRCCIANGEENFKWQLDKVEDDDSTLSWANLFINCNYLYFLENVVPKFANQPIIAIVNINAKSLPFNRIVHRFNIGSNCISRDYHLIEEVKDFIKTKGICNHTFLFAASSLSNMMIHQLFDFCDQNTYIDVGSSLNPFMPGIGSRRAYMSQIVTRTPQGKACIW